MAGTKNKSGGPRPGNPNGTRGRYDRSKSKKTGPPVRNIHLDKDAASELRTLLLNRNSLGSDIDEDLLVKSFIHEKWIEYDRSVQAAVGTLEQFEQDEAVVL